MEYEKQLMPLEREVSPNDAFIKGSIFAMQERGIKKRSTPQSRRKR